MSNRVESFSIGRVTDAGADTGTDDGVLGDRIYGQVMNIRGGNIVMTVVTSSNGGTELRYTNGTFRLEDLTFTLLDISEQPSKVLNQDIYFDRIVQWTNPSGEVKSRKVRFGGQLTDPGGDNLEFNSDSPRDLILMPFEKIEGGGENQNTMTTTGSALHANTRTGDLYVNGVYQYTTRRTVHEVPAVT